MLTTTPRVTGPRVIDLRLGDLVSDLGPFHLHAPLRVAALVPVTRGPWSVGVTLVDPETGAFRCNLTARGDAAVALLGVAHLTLAA